MNQNHDFPDPHASRHAGAEALGPQVVIDGIRPTLVPNPQADDYRCVGYLSVEKTSGWKRGTGTLIAAEGGYGILTCAHVLYDNSAGGPASQIEFAPARTGDNRPYNIIVAESNMLRIPDRYQGEASIGTRDDYAVVRLDPSQVPREIGPLPGMATLPVADLGTVQVTGYPAEEAPRPTRAMYYSQGATLNVGNDPAVTGLLRYKASTLPGSSGSGVCRVRAQLGGGVPELKSITAVHVDGDRVDHKYNWGVYLTKEIIDWVVRQIAP